VAPTKNDEPQSTQRSQSYRKKIQETLTRYLGCGQRTLSRPWSKITPFPRKVKKLGLLAHLHFCSCLFCEKASLWPGSKGVARKKHRLSYFGLRISDFFGFLLQSAFRNRHSAIWGRAYRALPNSEFGILCFFFSILHSAFYIAHLSCPPDPENEPCLMVFARNALAFGPGTGRNSIGLTTTCRKVKVGKVRPQNLLLEPSDQRSDECKRACCMSHPFSL